MNYSDPLPAVQRCTIQHSVDYLHEALQVWLAASEKINYSAQDNDILTAFGFRPDPASRNDNREKFTPAQNWPRNRPFKNHRKSRHLPVKKTCIHKVHGFANVLPALNPHQRQYRRALRPFMHLHLKRPLGGQMGRGEHCTPAVKYLLY